MKQRLLLVALVVVIFAFGCERTEQPETVYSTPACYDPLFQRDGTCDFRGIRWGMSPEEVKAAENMEVFEEGPHSRNGEYLLWYKEVHFKKLPNATLRFFFHNDQCFRGIYYFYGVDFLEYESLSVIMADIYGASTYSNKDIDDVIGWQTANSYIFLGYYYDDGKLTATITFGSKDLNP